MPAPKPGRCWGIRRRRPPLTSQGSRSLVPRARRDGMECIWPTRHRRRSVTVTTSGPSWPGTVLARHWPMMPSSRWGLLYLYRDWARLLQGQPNVRPGCRAPGRNTVARGARPAAFESDLRPPQQPEYARVYLGAATQHDGLPFFLAWPIVQSQETNGLVPRPSRSYPSARLRQLLAGSSPASSRRRLPRVAISIFGALSRFARAENQCARCCQSSHS